jgi:hypothetical protein
MNDTNETPKQYQCRHIFTDGRRCASPCLRQEEFCYYHHTTRRPVANPRQRRSRRSTFDLPLPEDRSAIQSSIGEVLRRIASNDIDPRRAGLLLYGLQIASLNLPKPQPTAKAVPETPTVEEITIDSALGILAPRTEVGKVEERKSSVRLLIERMAREKQEKEQGAKQLPESTTIPTLQATEENPIPSTPEDVISTGGGALAAAVEKPASPPQPSPSQRLAATHPPRRPVMVRSSFGSGHHELRQVRCS